MLQQTDFDVQMNASGRIVIPSALRQECGLKPGDSLKLSYVDGNFVISSPQMALRYLQDLVQKHCPPEVDLVEELFKMRREEFKKEEEGARR